ncbi:MAG: SHOCT domain-containing protein [bacterium]|nr:SHOCT domain-containing protein [bacterium]
MMEKTRDGIVCLGMHPESSFAKNMRTFIKNDEKPLCFADQIGESFTDHNSYLILTNKRLYEIEWDKKKGWTIQIEYWIDKEYMLTDIEDVRIDKQLGYDGASDFILGSSSTGLQGRTYTFVKISGFERRYTVAEEKIFYDLLTERIREIRTKNPKVDAGPSKDIPTQIREFAKLRDDGLISEEEFQAKKKDILN